MVQLVFHPYS